MAEGYNLLTHDEPAYDMRALLACLEVGKLLVSTVNLTEILSIVVEKAAELIPAQNWSLLLMDDDTDELVFEIAVGDKADSLRGIRLPRGQGIVWECAESRRAIFLPDVSSDPRFNRDVDATTGFVTESIICLPLVIHNRTIGVLELVNVRDMETFGARYLPILRILADYAAIGIEKSRSFARIRLLSITDEYTGLYNARYLHEILETRLRIASRSDQPLSVAFADVDEFKKVVDTHGHVLGSQLLAEIGAVMRAALSDSDILCKYGGDEFVLLMPGRDAAPAREHVEKIRASIAGAPYLAAAGLSVRVTVSFGISTFPHNGTTGKDLLLAADKALYSVKNSTKNGAALASRED